MNLFNGNPVDPEAYDKGQKAWNESPQKKNCKGLYPPMSMLNPYQFGTDQWYSWNKGWNSVDPEEPVKVITDFQMTEVSLMPDGTYAAGGFIRPKKS